MQKQQITIILIYQEKGKITNAKNIHKHNECGYNWAETIFAQKFCFAKMNSKKKRTGTDHFDKLISHFVLFSFSSKDTRLIQNSWYACISIDEFINKWSLGFSFLNVNLFFSHCDCLSHSNIKSVIFFVIFFCYFSLCFSCFSPNRTLNSFVAYLVCVE